MRFMNTGFYLFGAFLALIAGIAATFFLWSWLDTSGKATWAANLAAAMPLVIGALFALWVIRVAYRTPEREVLRVGRRR